MNSAQDLPRPTQHRRVWVLREGAFEEQDVEMVQEEPLALTINRQQVAILMRLPGMEKELAAGFCVSEGLLRSFDDVLMIHHCSQKLDAPEKEGVEEALSSRNRVEVIARPEGLHPEARLDVVRLIRAGCGAVDVARTELGLQPALAEPKWEHHLLSQAAHAMRGAQQLHVEVGGVHAAALFGREGELVILCEDIGRHNAVDKTVGYCLLHGITLTDKLLLCSGRLSYEMVTKAIRMGIPCLASFSAPTALAIQLAERFGITIVGYLREQRMTIYTHPERIYSPE